MVSINISEIDKDILWNLTRRPRGLKSWELSKLLKEPNQLIAYHLQKLLKAGYIKTYGKKFKLNKDVVFADENILMISDNSGDFYWYSDDGELAEKIKETVINYIKEKAGKTRSKRAK